MADLLRQELARLLERDVKDPRIGFATLTSVVLSRDLRTARVYVSILGDEDQKCHSMEGLNAASNFLRYQIAQRLNLRYTPAIEFQLDRSAEVNERLDELLRRTKRSDK
ncbi:MAG: 30S ribosome-binding factor RbfA [Acidobacteria bacterium]|nr:30S ribosome-binding factor RbfA [Acidobacteriota bacterium]